MTSYTLPDLTLSLPDTLVDDLSMNVLKFQALGTALVITRGILAQGQTLGESFDAQIAKLQQQSRAFQSHGRSEITLGEHGEIAAIEVENQLQRDQETIWQYQLVCEWPQAPGAAGKMLALSYIKHAPLTAQDRAQWDALKASVRLLDVRPAPAGKG